MLVRAPAVAVTWIKPVGAIRGRNDASPLFCYTKLAYSNMRFECPKAVRFEVFSYGCQASHSFCG